jgi:hypothetical protein
MRTCWRRRSSAKVVLCADMDLSDRISGVYNPDVVGHYARPGVGVQV